MERALKILAWSLPLVFAFAFLVPMIDQGLQTLGLAVPFGLSTLTFALMIGSVWGLIAQTTGRWL